MIHKKSIVSVFLLTILSAAPLAALPAQHAGGDKEPPSAAKPFEAAETETGTIRGTVTLQSNGGALHLARVLVTPLGRSVETDESGKYEIVVPVGTYDVVVRSPALSDARQTVQVTAGATVTADFSMRIATVREQITVTASGQEITPFESFSSTNSLDSIDLVQRKGTSLGEVLEGQPGIAKRGFGAGNARPVIRGFDGDRVLVMLDGLPGGSLASQSGDHGENIDVLSLERVEVVRGPATLLYGSNAIGGVVNAISGDYDHLHVHPGLSGYLTGLGGSANALGGGAAGINFGIKDWSLHAGGRGQRTGDYDSPLGAIVNSRQRDYGANGGAGYYGKHFYFRGAYDYDNRRYGIPFAAFFEEGPPFDPDAEVVNLRLRRHDYRLSAGARDLPAGPIEAARMNFNYVDYNHGEFDGDTLGTNFFNRLFNIRSTFDQRKAGPLTGTFGFSYSHRDYNTLGDEALAPPVTQDSLALFAFEALAFEHFSVQFGGRYEHVEYQPGVNILLPSAIARNFDGFSGSAGVRVPLWSGGAFVVNYNHSFRAPALEELYNNGVHPGNVAFEIGNQNLKNESGNGVDVTLRHQAGRFRTEGTYFFIRLSDYVFLTPTGNVTDGFPEAEYLQADTRYHGFEWSGSADVHRNVTLLAGFDIVKAELRSSITSPTTLASYASGTPLPRITPMRGRVGADFHWKGFAIRPEGVFTADQNDIFPTETPTPGATQFNLGATYTYARQHAVHVFSINAFNLTDAVARNHLSFIKDLAPEIGRGVRFSYTMRFF